MSQVIDFSQTSWTAADLVERFGAIPLCRIRYEPAPGSATADDVIEIHNREDRLYELIDGVLLEKTMGTFEAYLAMRLGRLVGNFVDEKNLGIVLGADGMMRLAPGLIRIPDVSFISWKRLPNHQVPRDPIADLSPDLAVEVIRKSNTPREMEHKLQDYFEAGVQLVWYVYPTMQEVRVYVEPDEGRVVGAKETLDGGEVLPGFTLDLKQLFTEPQQPAGT